MYIKNLNSAAFTLLEILLSAVIFVITIAGVFATLNAVRTPVASKESSLTAAVFGKQVLDALRSYVSAASTANYYSDTNCSGVNPSICTDFSLALGTHQVTVLPTGLNWPSTLVTPNTVCSANTVLCLQYTVSCADGTGSYGNTTPCITADVGRRVDLNINY